MSERKRLEYTKVSIVPKCVVVTLEYVIPLDEDTNEGDALGNMEEAFFYDYSLDGYGYAAVIKKEYVLDDYDAAVKIARSHEVKK